MGLMYLLSAVRMSGWHGINDFTVNFFVTQSMRVFLKSAGLTPAEFFMWSFYSSGSPRY
jgi:hypothetical protein